MAGLTLEDLSTIMLKEKKKAALSELPPDFFQRLLETRDKIRQEYIDAMKDPHSEGSTRMQEHLVKWCKVAEMIYEIRINKVMDMARVAAVGGALPVNHQMAQHELNLYHGMIEMLKGNKQNLFRSAPAHPPPPQVTAPPPSPPQPAPPPPAPAPQPAAPPVEKVEPPKVAAPTEPPAEVPPAPSKEMVLIAKKDVRSFALPDGRSVKLSAGDIITLPTSVAKVLLNRDLAREFRGSFD